MALEKLYNKLDSLSGYDFSNRVEARELISSLSNASQMKDILNTVKNNHEVLTEVAKRSYRHPNEFDKIILASSSSDRYKLRLHIWHLPQLINDNPNVNIHNHRWDFSSVMLTGSMHFEIYERTEEGQCYHEYRYEPSPEPGAYAMNYIGESYLQSKFSGTLQSGDDYALSHDIPHLTYIESDVFTATLVLQGPVKKQQTNVFAPKKLGNLVEENRQTLQPQDVKKQIDELLKHINPNS